MSPVTAPGYHSGRTAPNKGRTYPAEILTEDEVKSLIRACSNRALTGIRNRALIVTLYRAGLRLSEALALKPKDVDADGGTITVLHGKGDRRRVVGIDPGSMAIILRWANRRRTLGRPYRRHIGVTAPAHVVSRRVLDSSYDKGWGSGTAAVSCACYQPVERADDAR